MAAENSSSTGRKNYYGVSYGKLSTRVKEVPEGFTEITEADLKSKTQAVEQIDLRNKFVNKGKGDYPYVVFYDSITGHIKAQEKFENDNGTNLNLTVIDKDGDESILQLKFYSKYAENLLNRLLAANLSKQMTFFPYSIPNTAEIDGQNKSFYTSGVSLKIDGMKVEPKLKDKRSDSNSPLPDTAQVKVQGKMTTSRDERVDYLYTEFATLFETTTTKPPLEDDSDHVGTTPRTPKPGSKMMSPSEAFEPATNVGDKKEGYQELPF